MRDRPVSVRRLLPVLAVALCGCPATSPFPPLYPVVGDISKDDKPVTSGGIGFVPDDGRYGGVNVSGSVSPDGTFATETSRTTGTGSVFQPGVPAGRYRLVYHPTGSGEQTGGYYKLPDVLVVGPDGLKVVPAEAAAEAGSGGRIEVAPGGATLKLMLPPAKPKDADPKPAAPAPPVATPPTRD